MTSPESLTPAQRYQDAVWRSTRLTPEQRLVALVYANHTRGGTTAWVVTNWLMARTGIRSRGTACAVVEALVTAGWLVYVGPHPEHKQRRIYRLTIPDESAVPEPSQPRRARGTDGRYATKTGPRDGPVHGWNRNRSTQWTETGPRNG